MQQTNLGFEATFEVEAIKTTESSKLGLQAEEDGVFLTWEDLWFTVSNGKNGRKAILQGLTGFAKPGQLLAVMGPSGCGKSTLLDALAGNQLIPNLRIALMLLILEFFDNEM